MALRAAEARLQHCNSGVRASAAGALGQLMTLNLLRGDELTCQGCFRFDARLFLRGQRFLKIGKTTLRFSKFSKSPSAGTSPRGRA